MAESSEDIESGSQGLQSLSRSKMVDFLDTKLRNIAFNLALMEKGASTLGTMNFIWATVVLLGGFSASLKSIDFWFVSIILVVEGLRILCRSGELAIQLSLMSSNFSFFNLILSNINLSWSNPTLILSNLNLTLSNLIGSNPTLSIVNLSLIHLYSVAIQEYSAIACIVLSSLRIHNQQYGSYPNPNRNRALNLFYWLSTVESCLTLFGSFFRLCLSFGPNFLLSDLIAALKDDGFDDSQLSVFPRYFFDTYSRCINGNVFDGLKMDFLSYSVELLQSIDDNDQLAGARILSVLLKSDSLHSEKLRVIRTIPGVLERLIELLNWEKPQEREIRTVAGEIICKLVQIPLNRIRVMAIPESLESITSLLYNPDQIVLGKRILNFLSEDPDNHAKIGTNRGLRHRIIALHQLSDDASVSEIIQHLSSMETVTRTDQQDGGENIEGTSRVEAEHSDDPTSQSVDSQV